MPNDKPNIVVTEDDQVQRDIITDILLRADYDVTASASGHETMCEYLNTIIIE